MSIRVLIFSIVYFFCGFTFLFSQGTWTQKANFLGTARYLSIGFSIGNKGYVGTGWDGVAPETQDFWEWDKTTNTWTQKASFPGVGRSDAASFSIGTKGYIGTGGTSVNVGGPYFSDFWEWDQSTNIWTQKANFGGTARFRAIGFSIGTMGYIGMGYDGSYKNDLWEWNQTTNTWTQKANLPGQPRWQPVGLSIGSKGYIGLGYDNGSLQDFWEWDQTTNTWTQKANYGGIARSGHSGFIIGTKAYVGTGYNLSLHEQQDFWEWDQTTNVWTQIANFGGGLRCDVVGFAIGNCGYGATGYYNGNYYNDLWEYCPDAVATPTILTSGSTTICAGQSTTLAVSSGGNYSWNTGDTTSTIIISPSATTSYSVVATNGCSCSSENNITITVIPCSTPVSAFSAVSNTICVGNCVQFTDKSSGSPSAWQWNFSGGKPSSSNSQNPLICYDSIGTYNTSLIVFNSNGSDSSSHSNYITVIDCYCPEIYLPNAFSPNGDNENDTLFVQGTKCVNTFSFVIYNRWGEKVFESTDIAKGWDGTYNGKKENSAVYTYYLEATLTSGSIVKKKGNISLVR